MDIKKVNLKELLSIQDDAEALTHGGRFHADDVFATALLRIVKPEIKIRRVNELPEKYNGLIYDIGCGEYDHHQSEKRVRENGIEYASFGLLWRKLGVAMLGEEIAHRIDQGFVQKIDYTDNTGKKNLLSEAISEFNPVWNEEKEYDRCFEEAVSFAIGILKRKIEGEQYTESTRQYLHKKLKDNTEKCVVLDRPMPWKGALIGTDTEFVIFPSARGGYMIQTVPISDENPTPVVEFPHEWYGADKETLRRVSGVKTITFCHPTGFIASAEKLEDVRRIAEISRRAAGALL